MKKIKVIKAATVNAKPSSACDYLVDDWPMNKR
jgi:hypothetical protein